MGSATITSTLLYTCTIPNGADLTKATLLDQWVQWRGVGNILTLVNLQEAGINNRLGIANNIWSSNPALPFAIEAEATAPNAVASAEFGYADISSYGSRDSVERGADSISLPTSTISLDNVERPLITVQAAGLLGGMACTRNHHIDAILSITVDAASFVRIRQNAIISNSNVTWSIPDPTRGIIQGFGSNLATINAPGRLLFDRRFSAGEKIDIDDLPEMNLLPVPGALTTGVNRGNPAFGETWTLTVQKVSGGDVKASCSIIVKSLY